MTTIKLKKIGILLLLTVVGLSQTGCFGVSSHFKSVRNSIAKNVDNDYVQRFEFSVGRSLMSFAGLFIRIAENVNEEGEKIRPDELLAEIDRVEMSIFEKRDHRPSLPESSTLDDVTWYLEDEGYEYFVRFRDRDEMGMVFLREHNDNYDRLLLITFADENLVIVEMRGDLGGMIDWVLKKKNRMEMASN